MSATVEKDVVGFDITTNTLARPTFNVIRKWQSRADNKYGRYVAREMQNANLPMKEAEFMDGFYCHYKLRHIEPRDILRENLILDQHRH